jgi:quercetin dioxygenase-like cupin family protein
MESALDKLGSWPIPGEEARKNGRMIHIPREKALRVIHGKKNHFLMSFFISNNYVHFGTIQIPKGIYSDPETHKGDEVLFVLKGTLTVQAFNNNNDDESVLHESYEIDEGEQFLMPEGVKHRYLNFSNNVVEALFAIAPEL